MDAMNIRDALGWAYERGQTNEHLAAKLSSEQQTREELASENAELKERLMKLAADLQLLMQQNEAIRAEAAEQARALTTEVETLKAKVARPRSSRPTQKQR